MSVSNTETGNKDFGPELIEVIRKSSEAARLETKAHLLELFPEADVDLSLGVDGESSGDGSCSSDYSDLRILSGSEDAYYFSVLSMSETYARYLFRIEEKNLPRLVADTVREESRIYPRPTPARTFSSAPFSISEPELLKIIDLFGSDAETEDLRSYRASNGALYLYSSRYFEPVHAESLVEWDEVERWNNP